jgi:hypothetical protein
MRRKNLNRSRMTRKRDERKWGRRAEYSLITLPNRQTSHDRMNIGRQRSRLTVGWLECDRCRIFGGQVVGFHGSEGRLSAGSPMYLWLGNICDDTFSDKLTINCEIGVCRNNRCVGQSSIWQRLRWFLIGVVDILSINTKLENHCISSFHYFIVRLSY